MKRKYLWITLILCGVALVVFIIAAVNSRKFAGLSKRIEKINIYFDAIGLAAFTVMSTELAFTYGFSDNVFLSLVLGVLPAVGGGLLRDILTETPPYIFTKHVYAVAALVGSALYYTIRLFIKNTIFPGALAIFFIIGVRMLATKYRWKLPKVHLEEEEQSNDRK